jgi:hypothetical protein
VALCYNRKVECRCSEVTGEERSGMKLSATAGVASRVSSEIAGEKRSGIWLCATAGKPCVAAVSLVVRSVLGWESVLEPMCLCPCSEVTGEECCGLRCSSFWSVPGRCIEVSGDESSVMSLCATVRSVIRGSSEVKGEERRGMKLCATIRTVTVRFNEFTCHEGSGKRSCATVLTVAGLISGEERSRF